MLSCTVVVVSEGLTLNSPMACICHIIAETRVQSEASGTIQTRQNEAYTTIADLEKLRRMLSAGYRGE